MTMEQKNKATVAFTMMQLFRKCRSQHLTEGIAVSSSAQRFFVCRWRHYFGLLSRFKFPVHYGGTRLKAPRFPEKSALTIPSGAVKNGEICCYSVINREFAGAGFAPDWPYSQSLPELSMRAWSLLS
jgi:hypothetical protein